MHTLWHGQDCSVASLWLMNINELSQLIFTVVLIPVLTDMCEEIYVINAS